MGDVGGRTDASAADPEADRAKAARDKFPRAHWRQMKRDVWDEPTIRSVGAGLLTALVFFIVYLTLEYAPHTSELRGRGIAPETGLYVIVGVALGTLVAAYEPVVGRHVGQWIWRWGRRAFFGVHPWLQAIAVFAGCLLFSFFKVLSVAWSFIDYLLARPVAVLAGARETNWVRRYARFTLIMSAAVAVAWFASDGALRHFGMTPAVGMTAVAIALTAVLGIVRRWSWFEADRDTYLIERGGTRDGSRRPSPRELRERMQLDALLGFLCAGVLTGAAIWQWRLLSALPPPLLGAVLALLVGIVAFCIVTLALALAALMRGDPAVATDDEIALRIGFKEDLRDEALFSILFLLALAPLALDLVYQLSDRTAFVPREGRPAIPDGDTWKRLGLWLGYFGAELAKAVPFVDWSEVFHAVNEADVKPADGAATPIGAQTVFVMRASLDLLLLATVVQAVGMVSRLREQNIAFRNNQLPILEPFSEARELLHANEGILDELDIPPAEQHSVVAFPNYDAKRLRELIKGDQMTPTRLLKSRDKVRRAAVALLAAKHRGGATDAFLFSQASVETDQDLRHWLLDVASGLAPESAPREADRTALVRLISNTVDRRIVAAPVRAAAARRLGRIGGDESVATVLLERLRDKREDVEVRADAAVALSKLDASAGVRAEALELARALAATFVGAIDGKPVVGEPLLPAMATAHAIARLDRGLPAAQIAACFHADLRAHVERAALIQIDPLKTEAAFRMHDVGPAMDELVRIEAGTFKMGFDFNRMLQEGYAKEQLREDGWRDDQAPETSVTIERAFALGRFPVTNREYRGFCDAMGLKRVDEDVGALDVGVSKRPQAVEAGHLADYPVVQVSWYDAIAYARWLERITGERYRLPTEAEWEYACRAGTKTAYWWDTDEYHEPGQRDLYTISRVNLRDDKDGSIGPNPWGLWSLYGHVYEWCADPWHKNLECHPRTGRVWLESAAVNPTDPNRRVVRGGSFNWPRPGPDDRDGRRNEIRSTYRNEQVPGHIQTNYGFRLARSLSD